MSSLEARDNKGKFERQNKTESGKNMMEGNFFRIYNDYVTHYARYLSVVATAVYTSLCKHADINGKCWPSMDLIAEQHGIERHAVGKAIKKLEEWNMINTGKSYDRKLKRRKNNTYILVPRKFWKDLPVEYDIEDNEDHGNEDTIDDLPLTNPKSHGNKNTMYMESKIPDYGTEDTSNKTHVTRTIKEDTLCGEPTELPLSLSKKLQLLGNGKIGVSKLAIWNSDKAIQSLINNDCKDYQIIGEYFLIQKLVFNSKLAFEEKLKRSLKPAKALLEYRIGDIRKTMKWLNDSKFDMDWSLEAVLKYIDDCVKTNFIQNSTSRIELLNRLNNIEIPSEIATQPETTAFISFWNAYPKKMDRLSAEKAFNSINPNLYPKILDSVELQKKTEQWQKAEYIPLASKWLEGQRWEDEVVVSTIDPIEAYARELIKQFPPDNDTTAQFRFSRKYGNQNLLRFKSLFQL